MKMSERVDARGLSCPQPVVLTAEQVVAGHSEFEVVVDTEVSFENVRRFLESKGYSVGRTDAGDGIVVEARQNIQKD
jgi:tRNA 2-thiouridine synthesizing protein A